MPTFVRTKISYVTMKPDGKGGWVDLDERICFLHNLCISGDSELAIQQDAEVPAKAPEKETLNEKLDIISKLKKGAKK